MRSITISGRIVEGTYDEDAQSGDGVNMVFFVLAERLFSGGKSGEVHHACYIDGSRSGSIKAAKNAKGAIIVSVSDAFGWRGAAPHEEMNVTNASLYLQVVSVDYP